jgi:hypothetical protein
MKTGIGNGSQTPENRENGDKQKRKSPCTEYNPLLLSVFPPKLTF